MAAANRPCPAQAPILQSPFRAIRRRSLPADLPARMGVGHGGTTGATSATSRSLPPAALRASHNLVHGNVKPILLIMYCIEFSQVHQIVLYNILQSIVYESFFQKSINS